MFTHYDDLPHPGVKPYDFLPRNATLEEYDRIARDAYGRRGSRASSWWGQVHFFAMQARGLSCDRSFRTRVVDVGELLREVPRG